jgi:hypothetical protein
MAIAAILDVDFMVFLHLCFAALPLGSLLHELDRAWLDHDLKQPCHRQMILALKLSVSCSNRHHA